MAGENLYEVRQLGTVTMEGYTGDEQYAVYHESLGSVTVKAPDMAAALWTAAKHWGQDPRKCSFRDYCRVQRR